MCVVVVGSQAVCNVAEAPKHTICGAVYFFVSPPPLRRRVIAFALQFLVWLAENREGDLMNQRTLQRTRFMLYELTFFFYSNAHGYMALI